MARSGACNEVRSADGVRVDGHSGFALRVATNPDLIFEEGIAFGLLLPLVD
jgi:hypothetical protein